MDRPHEPGTHREIGWARLPARAKAFRIVHAAWSLAGLWSLGYVWAAALRRRRGRTLVVAVAFLAVEGLGLVAGRGNCPMAAKQAEWGDPVPFFELLLPPRAAKAAVPILAAATVVGLLAVVRRRPLARSRSA